MIEAKSVAGIGTFHSKSVVANPSDCLLRGIWSFPVSSTPSGSTQKAFFRKLLSFAYGHAHLQAGPSLKMYTVHFLNGRSPSGSTFLPAGRHGARHSSECNEERRRASQLRNIRLRATAEKLHLQFSSLVSETPYD